MGEELSDFEVFFKREYDSALTKDEVIKRFCKSKRTVLSLAEREKNFVGHKSCVNTLSFSHDGEKIISGSDDTTVKIWDVSTNDCEITLRGHTSNVFAGHFFPHKCNKVYISGGNDSDLRYWEVANHKEGCCTVWQHHTMKVLGITINPAMPDTFLSCSSDGTIRYFDVRKKYSNSYSHLLKDDIVREPVIPQAFGGGRRAFASKLNRETILLNFQRMREHALYSVKFHPFDGRSFIVSSEDGNVRLYDLRYVDSNNPLYCVNTYRNIKLINYEYAATGCSFSHDGSEIVATNIRNYIYTFRTSKIFSELTYTPIPKLKSRLTEKEILSSAARRSRSTNDRAELNNNNNNASSDDADRDDDDNNNENNTGDDEEETNLDFDDNDDDDDKNINIEDNNEDNAEEVIDVQNEVRNEFSENGDKDGEEEKIQQMISDEFEVNDRYYEMNNNDENECINIDNNNDNDNDNNNDIKLISHPSSDNIVGDEDDDDGGGNTSLPPSENVVEIHTPNTSVDYNDENNNIDDMTIIPPTTTTTFLDEVANSNIITDDTHWEEDMYEFNVGDDSDDEDGDDDDDDGDDDDDDDDDEIDDEDDVIMLNNNNINIYYPTMVRAFEVYRNHMLRDKLECKKADPNQTFEGQSYEQVFNGHLNKSTIKGVGFFGPESEYVISGSDDGVIYIWDKRSSKIVNMLIGHKRIVNCVEPHPTQPVLISSGLEKNIKLWEPTKEIDDADMQQLQETIQTCSERNNRRMESKLKNDGCTVH